jgi:pimeloyl-ACP methyl ester carboxylesterase
MHGAWCWYKIVELLEKDGHKVSAIDLMSAGTNPPAADSINSFKEYNQPLMHFLAKLPQTEKIVLVGHSMGGVSLTRGSEDLPHLIAVAVYVCTFMFRGGESLQREKEMMENNDRIEQMEYNFGNGIGEPPTSGILPRKFHKDLFYSTSSTLDATLASLLLRPFPIMAMKNMSLETTDEGYGVVPRVYIKTLKDNALSLAKQEVLITNSPPQKVYSIDSDHSPFFSAPEKLHSLLLEIANTYCL